MRNDLSAEEIRSLFTYDPKESFLRWKFAAGMGGRILAGTPAGSTASSKEGYRNVNVKGKLYRASRLIWVYMTGEWPPHQVDHKDLDTGNDRWENLRLASSSQNASNRRKKSKATASCPLKGVQAVQKRKSIRYRAVATKDWKIEHLGYFDTPELAHAAYLKRIEELHGEFARPE